jgi:hypothetical protein
MYANIQKFWNPTVSLRHVQSVVRPAVETCPAVQAVRSETGCAPESENAEWQIDCPRFFELLQYHKDDIAEWAAYNSKMEGKIAAKSAEWEALVTKINEHNQNDIEFLQKENKRLNEEINLLHHQLLAETHPLRLEEKYNDKFQRLTDEACKLRNALAEMKKAWDFAQLAVAEGCKNTTLDGLVRLKQLKDEERASRGGSGGGGISIPDRDRPTPTPSPG